ncbi:hypothetical protein MBLNU457_4094t1 [Dothideomycetes sp. NU457]
MPRQYRLLQSVSLAAYLLPHVLAQTSSTTSISSVTSTTDSTSQSSSTLTTTKSHALTTSKFLFKSSTLPLTTNSTSPPSIAPTGDPITDITAPPITNGGLVNYFFIFLALILCVIGLGAWLYYRARKRATRRLRNSRSNALARDLDGQWPVDNERWHQRRHWMSGHWRGGAEGNRHGREEGLNEEGEAPPPYVIKTDEEQDEGVRRPESAVVRERYEAKPPEYHETFIGSSSDETASIEAEEEAEESGRRSTGVDTAGRERNESRRRNMRFGPLPPPPRD